ncbi:alpha/beta hydrolase [Cupriavidus basilensis]
MEYRLAPEHQWPVPLRDCEQALGYLVANAAALSIDASRVVLAGDSAGGSMATIISNGAGYRGVPGRRPGAALSVTDLTASRPSYGRASERAAARRRIDAMVP